MVIYYKCILNKYNYWCIINHATASEIEHILPEKLWKDSYKFAFVRNPYFWQASHCHCFKQYINYILHHIVANMKLFIQNIEDIVWQIYINILHLYASIRAGKLPIDVYKLEAISQHKDELYETIGIPIVIYHTIKSRHRVYQQYYDKNTNELIYIYHRYDSHAFGYDYESY